MKVSILCAAAVAATQAACISRDVSEVTGVTSGEVLKDIPISADIDILFLIDNSPSTADKQNKFAENFPRFIQALDSFPGGRPNVHIGVVSSTMQIPATTIEGGLAAACTSAPNDNGLLRNQAAAGSSCTPPSGRFISDVANGDGSRAQNYPGGSGKLAETFSCIARLGSGGCAFEQQLAAIKAALDGSRPENAGFLRPGAYLAVIILTDEDDCSARDPAIYNLPVSEVGPIDFRCAPRDAYICDQPITLDPATYTNCRVKRDGYLQDPQGLVQFLTQLKGDPNLVLVGLIGGPAQSTIRTGPITKPFNQALALEPSCEINDNAQIGRPANRLSDFLSGFPGRAQFSSVCANDYTQALADFGDLLFTAVSPCLGGNLSATDMDPNMPGVQLSCAVSDSAGDAATETPMARCPMTDANTPSSTGPRPCWWARENAAACGGGSGFELHIERSEAPPSNTHVKARCATE